MPLRSRSDAATVAMSTPAESLGSAREAASVLWFPVLFAIALPFVFLLAFHAPQPHQVPIAVVGRSGQVQAVSRELHAVNSGGFNVRHLPSRSSAMAAVRNRDVAAAYVQVPSLGAQLYVARAASAITANYLQQVFEQIASESRTPPPQTVDLVPLLPGDSGTGIFFFTFPMVMVGVITVLVLLQRAPTWSIERRLVAVAVMGAVGATMAYATAISLDVLPNKPVLLATAFFLSVIIGALLVGLAPFLKQYFLPVVMTYILILGVPSAGATIMPDLLPTGLRYLSDVLPLAQVVKIVRSEAYFDGADTLAPILILLVWAAIALLVVGIAWDSQANSRTMLSHGSAAAVPLVPSESSA
jgi:ABC-2 family transporter protein